MTDVLVRGLTDEVLAAIDSRAVRLGLSRNEYLRRRIAQDVDSSPVTVNDLARFAEAFTDLTDPDVMSGAWK